MPANLDKCVADVMAQGNDEDTAWAICRAALGEGEYPEGTSDKAKAIALTQLGESRKGVRGAVVNAIKALADAIGKDDDEEKREPAHPDKDDDEKKQARESRLAGLKESRNLGNWLEARIHSVFTNIADDLFGDGHMTREERISFSSAIGEALTAFNAAVQNNIPQVYERSPFDEPEDQERMQESVSLAEAGDGLAGSLVEAALRRDNTVGVKIIEPGWGSSGFYPAEVLERDGPKVFTSGTQMFWDHQTLTEELERPEGSLNSLAAELVSDARWQENGPKGPGLYADARVFGPYQEAVNELAGHIGVSIRADGEARHGTMEGRQGPIIQKITTGKSVDFVTRAGAGGEILELFEAARQNAIAKRGNAMEDTKLIERLTNIEQENARLRESLMLRDAQVIVSRNLQESGLPQMVQERLAGTLSSNPPVNEGQLDTEALAQKVQEAVEAEVNYLKSVAGYNSPVRGMGSTESTDNTDYNASLEEAFTVLTGSESAAKIAAKGR